MFWLLNLVYFALLIAVSPVLLYRMLALGKYREGWAPKLLGRLPRRDSPNPCVWLHAVSVGEVLQLQTIIRQLETRLPEYDFVITTTTATGLAVAQEKFTGPRHHVCYFPLDFSWAVSRALERIQPAAVVLVELELWPNFIMAAARRQIPLALINGRISEKSFRGYRKIRPLVTSLLNRFDTLAVQNELYRQRLVRLGAPPERITVTGSIKFDGVETSRNNLPTTQLRDSFGIDASDPVFIAGSTQPPEEAYALETWVTLREEFPRLRLILVPRHKERFDEVAALVEKHGLPLLRRSAVRGQRSEVRSQKSKLCVRNSDATLHPPPVLLLDTLGELSACWGLADVAFVGGSLSRRGGQNMIEPAAYGAAVLFGPNTQNFRDVVDLLLAEKAARVVADRDDLTRTVRAFLADPTSANRQGKKAQQLVLSQQGATERTARLIAALPIYCQPNDIEEAPKAA